MNNTDIKIGLVIPIYLTKFVKNCVSKILESNNRSDLAICIVNDGKEDVKSYIENQTWPKNVVIINLPENKCFAGANNAGWKHLIEKIPSIEFLGSINDDTIPRKDWLNKLVKALNKYPKTAIASPIMEYSTGFMNLFKGEFGLFDLVNADTPIVPNKTKISADTFVPATGGFCFLARRDALEEVDFFDESYRNSCEDVDLCLKLTLKGWRIVVCHDSKVFHIGGASRNTRGTNTNVNLSHDIFEKKWGFELNKYRKSRPKTVVHSCVFNQEHFIEAWVRNAAIYADEILVLYSDSPWNYNKNAKGLIEVDNTKQILSNLKKEFANLTVIEGNWKNETQQRTDAIKIAKKLGGELLLIVDTDEFFIKEHIFKAFDWIIENPSELYFCSHYQIIKKPEWSIITPDGDPKFQFAIDLNKVKKFENKRKPEARESLDIPEKICKCIHFSYLMPENKLKEKLLSFGHAHEIRENWLEEIWPNIKPGVKDFHPVNPAGWTGIKEISLPESILNLINTGS